MSAPLVLQLLLPVLHLQLLELPLPELPLLELPLPEPLPVHLLRSVPPVLPPLGHWLSLHPVQTIRHVPPQALLLLQLLCQYLPSFLLPVLQLHLPLAALLL